MYYHIVIITKPLKSVLSIKSICIGITVASTFFTKVKWYMNIMTDFTEFEFTFFYMEVVALSHGKSLQSLFYCLWFLKPNFLSLTPYKYVCLGFFDVRIRVCLSYQWKYSSFWRKRNSIIQRISSVFFNDAESHNTVFI